MTTQLSEREQKARIIASDSTLTCKGGVWLVPSQSGGKEYTVDPDPKSPRCSCPDFEFRRQPCKHIFAVEITLKREYRNDGQTETISETITVKKYSQSWPEYNRAQQFEKGHFIEFLHQLCAGIEEPIQTNGRPRLPLADIIFGLVYKTYAGVSGRRFASDLRDALAKGYISRMPSYNSIFDYFQMESLTPYLRQLIAQSAAPLQSIETEFAVDSSGFSTTNYVRWFDVKYGGTEDWHDWVKMHLMCGVKTHVVTSVEISRATANDSPFYKPLLESTAKAGFKMQEISADKGYISQKNLQATVDHGATPYIPFKVNTQPDRGSDLWSKMFFFYNYKREEFLTHYHKRSNVESVFQMIKSKFGERLRSKNETAQINEALTKVLAHNLCVVIQSMYELDITPEFCGEAA